MIIFNLYVHNFIQTYCLRKNLVDLHFFIIIVPFRINLFLFFKHKRLIYLILKLKLLIFIIILWFWDYIAFWAFLMQSLVIKILLILKIIWFALIKWAIEIILFLRTSLINCFSLESSWYYFLRNFICNQNFLFY